MNEFVLSKTVALRGLGYTHSEIAEKLGLNKHQVQYALSEVNGNAKRDGDTQTYMRIMGAGVLPQVTGLVGKLRKLEGL